MRIIFLTGVIGNGGAEREISVYSGAIAKYGHEVYIICTEDEKKDYDIDPRVNVQKLSMYTRVNIPVVRAIIRCFKIIQQLRKMHADFLLPFCVWTWYYPIFWSSTVFSKTKFLYLVRNNLMRYTSPEEKKKRKIGKITAHLADGIWIQTEGQRAYFPKYLQKKIFVVPNAIDEKFLNIPKRERKTIEHFISVGRIHPQKNQKMMIEAFEMMKRKTGNPNVTLVIYGRSKKYCIETEKEIKKLIKKDGLEECVFLPGWSEDIEKVYEEADAFVFSSDYEGMPNALMEAMSAGLPCISTNCQTGPSDLISSGENGILVPVGDKEAMAEAMSYFVTHPRQADKMGVAARSKMIAWDSSEKLARELLNNLAKIQNHR